MQTDRYGLSLSTSSPAARDAYVEGVDCLLGSVAGADGHLARALEADPDFALGHIALARARFLTAQVQPARAAAATARALSVRTTEREQSHVNALALAIEGKPADALAATREHVARFPRDALALAPATGVFGLIGFSGRQQREDEQLELLRGLGPHYGPDWWFLSAFAFAACECGLLDEAEDLIERSLAGNPRSALGAHIRAHVLYETGRPAQALAYLEDWMPAFPKRGLLHCHLSWHLALVALELGKPERAWEIYRADIHPGGAWGPPLNVVSDATSFLWRAELAGQPRQVESWRDVHAYAARFFPAAAPAFVDVHRALACAVAGDPAELEEAIGALEERVAAGMVPAGPVVPALAAAFGAFARGDWERAIELLNRARPETVRIGGSRAQRDLVDHTLVAALLKAGRADEAHGLIAARVARRPAVVVQGFGAA